MPNATKFRITVFLRIFIALLLVYAYKSYFTITEHENPVFTLISAKGKTLAGNISLGHGSLSVIIFIHPPKTGGSLIRVILEEWCRSNNKSCIPWYGGSMDGMLIEQSAMPLSKRNKIDMIYGHVPFGFHALLNLSRPVQYISILRDPLKQAVSAFHYMRFRDHYLGGAFALQSAILQLNNTLYSPAKSLNSSLSLLHLSRKRNALISLLLRKDAAFENANLCFSGYGGSDGWSRAHNHSLKDLQFLDNYALVQFADKVVNKAWESDCTGTLSPLLSMSLTQFLEVDWNWNSSWKTAKPSWDFGNNPMTSTFCCHHLWFPFTLGQSDVGLSQKCSHIRNKETLNCASGNMEKIDLLLITEEMTLSLRLLEKFLNWTIPEILKQARINEAVYVEPTPPPITAQDLIIAEKRTYLDRIVYLTAFEKFWHTVHSTDLSV